MNASLKTFILRSSRNSEVYTSEFLENLGKKVYHIEIYVAGSNRPSHSIMLPVSKGLRCSGNSEPDATEFLGNLNPFETSITMYGRTACFLGTDSC